MIFLFVESAPPAAAAPPPPSQSLSMRATSQTAQQNIRVPDTQDSGYVF